MDRVHASFESLYGTVESGWERKDGKIFVKIRIPANVTATVVLPVLSPEKVTEKGRSLDKANFSNIKMSDNNLVFSSGSGDYIFEFSED
jgi:alpha-L-rhamnosidase